MENFSNVHIVAKRPSHYNGIAPVISAVAVTPTPIHFKEIMINAGRQQLTVKHIGSCNPRHALVDIVEDVGAKKLVACSQNM